MSIDRPTFSESWYRVSGLTPRLHAAVNVHRQYFRGLRWFVVQAPASNRFFRLSDAAYHFIAMLDGRRTVSRVWQVCMERFGDAAPTQGEVIQLLCRLHDANLLQGNLAPDVKTLFERHRKRVWQDVRGAVGNLFFIRIPLWDPDRFLDRWLGLVSWVFTPYGLMLWAVLIMVGLWAIGSHMGVLAASARDVLNPGNLPLLYLAILVLKMIHEFGHAFACKYFGRQTGTGGEVHQMGLSLLFFTPLPFVDASSAWALRHKWHRIIVGASGMLAELAVAAVAAVIWTRTADGSAVHAIAYNIMLVASISSLAFNGNPFLRYDAYYILLDLLEIPNLDSRSKLYVGYLVKRYLWGLERAADPSHTAGEKGWLVFYAVAATLCRLLILAAIALMLMNVVFVVIGSLLAAALAIRWLLIPLGRLIHYLCASPDLASCRPRAMLTSAMAAGSLFILLGLMQLPDRCRIEGVVEPVDYAVVHMNTTGFVDAVLASGSRTGPHGPALLEANSPELDARLEQLQAERRKLELQRRTAQTKEMAAVQIMDEKIGALDEQIGRMRQELADLTVVAPFAGVWVAPDADRFNGMRLDQGQRIGVVIDVDQLRIRAVADQQVASQLIEDAQPEVSIRVKNRPDLELAGQIHKIIPAGQEQLPSAALGYAAGGRTRIDQDDASGRRAAVPFFEVLVVPSSATSVGLRPGQTMSLRFETSSKPLMIQAWRVLLQLFQRGNQG